MHTSPRPCLSLRSLGLLGLLLAVSVHVSPIVADEGGTWVELAPMNRPRQETGAARIGDRVFVVGGLIGFGTARDSVEVYDIATDRWSFAAPMPAPRDHMGVAALGGKLYVSGGYTGSFDARDELFLYDPATDSWTEGARLPEARGAHWMVAHGDRLYLFGGVDLNDEARDETFLYDPATDTWSRGTDMPTPREHLNAVVAGEFIHVLGGRAGRAFDVHERYDPATDTWASLAPMPTARSAMAAAAVGNKIYAMGGEIPRLFAVNEVYDVATDSWDTATPMPLPRHGVAAVALEDRILVPGGGTVQGLAPTVRMDAFIPQDTTASDSQVRFRFASFRAVETEPAGRAIVVRQGDGRGEVTVSYGTEDGSALAGLDYQPSAGTLRWADGDTARKSFPVPLLDDGDAEGEETVRLRLTDPVGAELAEPFEAVLRIEDDDGGDPGRLELEAEAFPALEGEGAATVTVRRVGGDRGAVSVEVDTEDLSATSGTDYTGGSATLQWADGEQGARTFTVPLVDDADPERTELVRVRLRGITGGAEPGRDTAVVAIRDDDGAGGCTEEATAGVAAGHLCLVGEGRFRVEAEWRDPRTGDSGLAGVIPESQTTGFFWFFSRSNVELIVKMLDGRRITGAFWVFYGALSDVEYWIVVTDTTEDGEEGAFRVFHNEPFELASFADTSAFPEPPSAPIISVPDPHGPGAVTGEGSTGTGGPTEPCEPDPETLCLGPDGRFRVTVSWAEPGGDSGVGQAEKRSEETGTFWFFSPDNLELVVKLIDGRPVNGHFWFFSGALSNVEYRITVTDTETGDAREYLNEQGTLRSRADTEAFDG